LIREVYAVGDSGDLGRPVAECFWVENGKVTEIRPSHWDLVTLRKTVGVAE
jgi:hypothetical protein